MPFQIFRHRYRPILTNWEDNVEQAPSISIMGRIEAYARRKVISSFYADYRVLSPEIANQRREELFIKYNGEEIRCRNDRSEEIDVVVLKSQSASRTENVLIICINITYQDYHPKHWAPFLENGADIVLWNPTKLGPRAYSEDLRHVISALRNRNPNQIIALTSYCMSSDPAILAVSEMRDPNIHLIIDRGHGNAPDLVRSMTLWGRVSLIRRIVDEECDCHGIEKIRDIQGRVLFIFPEKIDQIMNYGKQRSFTQDLLDHRINDDRVVIEGGDHWSKWDHRTYTQALAFLSRIGVVANQESFEVNPDLYPPVQPPSWFQKNIVPIKLKCKATISRF